MTHRFRYANPDNPATKARKASYNTREYRAAGQQAHRLVTSGQAHCWRCHRHIPPTAKRGTHWVVGHDDHNRSIIRGVECYPCNQRSASRAGNRAQARRHPQLGRKIRRVTPLDL